MEGIDNKMVEEPDIIQQLRKAEKQGVLKCDIHQPLKSFNITKQGSEDSEDNFFIGKRLIDDYKNGFSEYIGRESVYRSVIEFSPDGIFIVDLNGIVQYCNASAERLTGYSKEKIIGKSFSDIIGKIDKKKMMAYLDLFHLVLCGKRVDPFEINLPKKEGKEVTAEIKLGLLEKEDKKLGMQVIVRDISSKKIQENSIGGSERELRDFFDNANDLIQLVDSDGFFNFVNKKWKKIMGYSDDEIKKLHFSEILRKDYVFHCEKIFKKLSQGESFTNIDVVFKTKSGEDVFVNGNINAHVVDGELITTYGIFRDLTEQRYAFEELKKSKRKLRESEQMLKEAQEIAKMGRWEFYHADNRLKWSDAIYDIFEINPADFKESYESFLELVHPDDKELVNKAWVRSLSDKKSYEIEHRLLLKEGQVKWVIERCWTNFDGDGKPVHSVGIVQDITERKQAEGMMKALLGGSPVPQFVIDESHKIIHWNYALEKYTGFKTKDIMGTNNHWKAFYDQERPCLVDLLIDGKMDKIRELYKGKCEKSKLIDEAIEAIDFFPNIKGGIWLYFIAAPLYDAKRNIIGGLETLIDITDQKRIEEILVEERKRMDFILDITKIRIDIIDPEYNLQYVDNGWQKIYGDPSGRKCYEYFMDRNSPCINCGIPTALEIKEVLVTEESLPKENDRMIEVHTIPFQDSNDKWMVAEFNIDITERKKIEKEMERQINTIQLLNQIIAKGYIAKDIYSYLQEVITVLLCTLEYDGASVYFLDPDKKTASVACSKNISESFLDCMKKVSIDGSSMYAKLFRENDTIIVENFSKINPELARILDFYSFIISPVMSEGRVVGALHLASSHEHVFTESDSILIKSITSQIGTIIKNFRSEDRLLEKLNELKKWKKVTAGRELRMKELKKKIKELEERC